MSLGRRTGANRRAVALLLVLTTIPAGVAWRMAPLGLSRFALKYGGSVFYATLIYWLLVAVWPRAKSWAVGLGAMVVCFAVEAFKLVHAPALDAFRETLAGRMVLGRVFTWGAMVAYALAIVAVGTVDYSVRGRRK